MNCRLNVLERDGTVEAGWLKILASSTRSSRIWPIPQEFCSTHQFKYKFGMCRFENVAVKKSLFFVKCRISCRFGFSCFMRYPVTTWTTITICVKLPWHNWIFTKCDLTCNTQLARWILGNHCDVSTDDHHRTGGFPEVAASVLVRVCWLFEAAQVTTFIQEFYWTLWGKTLHLHKAKLGRSPVQAAEGWFHGPSGRESNTNKCIHNPTDIPLFSGCES